MDNFIGSLTMLQIFGRFWNISSISPLCAFLIFSVKKQSYSLQFLISSVVKDDDIFVSNKDSAQATASSASKTKPKKSTADKDDRLRQNQKRQQEQQKQFSSSPSETDSMDSNEDQVYYNSLKLSVTLLL